MAIVHRVLQQDSPKFTVVTRHLPVGEIPGEVRNVWSTEDISMVLSHLLKEWRKPAVEELHVNALYCSCSLGPVCYNRGFSI